jgi:hypothetical protein
MFKVTVFGRMEITETDFTGKTLKYSKTQDYGCYEVEENGGFGYDDDWLKIRTKNKTYIMFNKKDIICVEIEES